MMGVSEMYSSVASSARSPIASRTGVVCVWKPVMVFGLPAWPTTSTACQGTREVNQSADYLMESIPKQLKPTIPTRTGTGHELRSSVKVINMRGCMAVVRVYNR